MDEQLSFEDALNRLEQISQSLEGGWLRLEEGIALFEEGIRLAKVCNERLNSAELKISQIQNFSEQGLENKDESP